MIDCLVGFFVMVEGFGSCGFSWEDLGIVETSSWLLGLPGLDVVMYVVVAWDVRCFMSSPLLDPLNALCLFRWIGLGSEVVDDSLLLGGGSTDTIEDFLVMIGATPSLMLGKETGGVIPLPPFLLCGWWRVSSDVEIESLWLIEKVVFLHGFMKITAAKTTRQIRFNYLSNLHHLPSISSLRCMISSFLGLWLQMLRC